MFNKSSKTSWHFPFISVDEIYISNSQQKVNLCDICFCVFQKIADFLKELNLALNYITSFTTQKRYFTYVSSNYTKILFIYGHTCSSPR